MRTDTQQHRLFHEDIYEALKTDVQACGGAKKVGSALFPEKAADKAGELLNNCLNSDRPEKLSVEQVILLKKIAKQHGSFATVFFECDEIGLSHPTPIEPEDEKARLQREFIASVQMLEKIRGRMAAL